MNTMNNKNEVAKDIYADSNFLISYWLPDHENYKQACLKFFELIEKNYQFIVSPLIVDECWYKIWYIWKKQNPSNQKPFYEFYQDFKELLNFVVSTKFFKIIQFKGDLGNGCRQALENIKTYNFKPHDAFHLAMIEDNQIFFIVTKDSDFTKESNKRKLEEKGIRIITF